MPVLNALELCNGCGFEPMLASSAAGYCVDCQLTAGLADCLHEPNEAGTACRFCGIPAEPIHPALLAELLVDELEARGAIAPRQCGQRVADDDTCGEDAIAFVLDDETYRCASCLSWYAASPIAPRGLVDVEAFLLAGIERVLAARVFALELAEAIALLAARKAAPMA